MTGYGRGESSRNGAKFTVEISTVNRKRADLSLYLPRELDVLENRARDEINSQIPRGRIVARVSFSASANGKMKLKADAELAKRYAREYRKLAREMKLKDDLSIDIILRAPGVLQQLKRCWMWKIFGRPFERRFVQRWSIYLPCARGKELI